MPTELRSVNCIIFPTTKIPKSEKKTLKCLKCSVQNELEMFCAGKISKQQKKKKGIKERKKKEEKK